MLVAIDREADSLANEDAALADRRRHERIGGRHRLVEDVVK